MRKKKHIVIAALIAVFGVVFAIWWQRREPEYQGRKVSEWLQDLAEHKPTPYSSALKQIGTNAIPFAVASMAQNDSDSHKRYVRFQGKLPRILQYIFPKPKPNLEYTSGANVLFMIGPDAIPDGIALLKHESPTVRQAACCGLGVIRRNSAEANKAIPALIDALSDSDWIVRLDAAQTLSIMGADATSAVPALTKALQEKSGGSQASSYWNLRATAALALGKIGPPARGALPALTTNLQEADRYLRGQTAVAIWRISGETETVLPVLLHEMAGADEFQKWDWIVALGEMGPRAKSAIPQLEKELQQDSPKWVLRDVTNAFLKIDPKAAAEVLKIAPTNTTSRTERNSK